MANMLKTTVMLPEDTLQLAKITAVQEKTSLSRIFQEALDMRIRGKVLAANPDPMKTLGKFKLGLGKLYQNRADLYGKRTSRKMGI